MMDDIWLDLTNYLLKVFVSAELMYAILKFVYNIKWRFDSLEEK